MAPGSPGLSYSRLPALAHTSPRPCIAGQRTTVLSYIYWQGYVKSLLFALMDCISHTGSYIERCQTPVPTVRSPCRTRYLPFPGRHRCKDNKDFSPPSESDRYKPFPLSLTHKRNSQNCQFFFHKVTDHRTDFVPPLCIPFDMYGSQLLLHQRDLIMRPAS